MSPFPLSRFGQLRAASILAASVACAGASANLVSNPSFEAGTATTIDNWVLTPPAGPGLVTDYDPSGTSPYGPRFLVLNPGILPAVGSATNDFATTDFGQEYRVDFVYGQYGGQAGEQTLLVEISQLSTPTVIGTALFTNITPSTDFNTIWRQGSFTFTGTGLPTSITFSDAGSVGFLTSDLFVDNVSIVPVPEPATMAALGLGALALLRRRRK